MKFHNRSDAGLLLADKLLQYKNDVNTVVLALPRGGVPVGYEVAKKLNLPLDAFIVRKLGVPFQRELAMGAITSGDTIFFNEEVIDNVAISENDINQIIQEERAELHRREKKYRQGNTFIPVTGKNIILVDDGIATGASIHSSIIALKKLNPNKIIIAVPVAPQSAVADLAALAVDVICLYTPNHFQGVGEFYDDFSQTTDEEVICLLKKIHKNIF